MARMKKEAIPTLEDLTKRVRKLERALKVLENQPEFEPDLTPEQEADLERRILEVERNPGQGTPVKDVIARLLKK